MVAVISSFSSQQTRQKFQMWHTTLCCFKKSSDRSAQLHLFTGVGRMLSIDAKMVSNTVKNKCYWRTENFSVFLLKQRGLMGQWNIIIFISCAEGYSRCNWKHISPKKNISHKLHFRQDENRLLPCLTKTKTGIVHSWPLRKKLNN